MKTIEDAVIELGGIWPEQAKDSKWFVVLTKKLDGSHSELKLDKDKFESCAKRLGYINGYRWGVEYPTNGERPELAYGVLVHGRYDFLQNEWGEDNQVAGEAAWHHITAFRITDQRHKPADTSYLNAPTQGQSLTHSEEGLTHKAADEQQYEPVIVTGADIAGGGGGGGFMLKPEAYVRAENTENNWHERGELPPIGCGDFEWSLNGKCWERGLMLFNDGTTCLIANKKYPANRHHLKSLDPELKFRPIRTEREKVIEAAMKCCQAFPSTQLNFAEKLYDAGMLVLPQNSGETK